ncbi:hypothetical protein D1007_08139 [Hordeum vulgare]|nr:hypothetical protein D1007_08139 [Hordeum vulgare]
MPELEWNKHNPNLNAGGVYKNMAELRNALTMYCIQSNNIYGTEKNEKRKVMVHCPDSRCIWKLHATSTRGNKTIQIRYNNNPHTCPTKVEMHKSKLTTKNWLAENINGTEWEGSFELLYTYKAEVEKASRGSVVEIDHHNAAAAAAIATTLKAAKAVGAAVLASSMISKKGKSKQHWQPRSNKRKRHEFMTSTKGEDCVHDQEGEEFVLVACVGFGDVTSFPDKEPFQHREHDFVASATGSNRGATPTPDNSVPEITLVPAKNPSRNKQAKKVV